MAEKLTPTKYKELLDELKYYETTKRTEVAKAITHAKEFGDLSENAEYSAAKDEQVRIEVHIAKLEEILKDAEVIDESTVNTKVVSLGTLVTVFDHEYKETVDYRIVSTVEADSKIGKISDVSPIGKALLGKKKGDVVTVITPGGKNQLTIKEIKK